MKKFYFAPGAVQRHARGRRKELDSWARYLLLAIMAAAFAACVGVALGYLELTHVLEVL